MSFSSVLSDIVGSIFNSLLEWGAAWFKEERAAANVFEAKARKIQVESMAEGIALEKRIIEKAKATHTIKSPSAWNNAGKLLVVMFACMSLSGCFRFYVAAREYRPVIPMPERPELSSGKSFTQEDAQKLAGYAHKLETSVKAYNDWAISGNEQAGFIDP